MDFQFLSAIVDNQSQFSYVLPQDLKEAPSMEPVWAFSVEHRPDDVWKVSLNVVVSIKAGVDICCQYDVTTSNFFRVTGDIDEPLLKSSLIQARSSDLFAKCRELISRLSADSGYGLLILPPIPSEVLLKDVE